MMSGVSGAVAPSPSPGSSNILYQTVIALPSQSSAFLRLSKVISIVVLGANKVFA
jgi:hypothetical protein